MPIPRVARVRGPNQAASVQRLREEIAKLRVEMELPDGFSAEVTDAAEVAAKNVELPTLDRTDLEMLTIDPEGARDLDQALHIERDGDGYRVHYAIADVAAFVEPGGPVDREARERGQTIYGAEESVPLHPPAISAEAGSLLAGQDRPAVLWTHRLDADGQRVSSTVERAMVRSRRQLDYSQADEEVAAPDPDPTLLLLGEVGPLRQEIETERGAVILPMPEQEVEVTEDRWTLTFRSMLAVEEWNAQISLLTGFAAAEMMVEAGVGILRTLPPPDPEDVETLRREAAGMGVPWAADLDYPAFISALNPNAPSQAALLVASTRVLRGSGYKPFEGAVPEQPEHSALAGVYAHVTAPLRRLVDRYGSEICLAVHADEPVPGWVLEGMVDLPDIMRTSGGRARSYEREIIDLVEAGTVEHRIGEEFGGVVVSLDRKDETVGNVVVAELGIESTVTSQGPLPLGEQIRVQLTEASVSERRVSFVPVTED